MEIIKKSKKCYVQKGRTLLEFDVVNKKGGCCGGGISDKAITEGIPYFGNEENFPDEMK